MHARDLKNRVAGQDSVVLLRLPTIFYVFQGTKTGCEIRTKAPDQIGSIPPGHFGSMAPG